MSVPHKNNVNKFGRIKVNTSIPSTSIREELLFQCDLCQRSLHSHHNATTPLTTTPLFHCFPVLTPSLRLSVFLPSLFSTTMEPHSLLTKEGQKLCRLIKCCRDVQTDWKLLHPIMAQEQVSLYVMDTKSDVRLPFASLSHPRSGLLPLSQCFLLCPSCYSCVIEHTTLYSDCSALRHPLPSLD